MQSEVLLQEIERAFPFVKKPEGIDISFHKDDCLHCKSLREDLQQYQEEFLPPKGIREIYSEMSCLSAEGWRWALPSYLRFCVNNQPAKDETEFLIYNLGPEEKHHEETIIRLSKLSEEQIYCLVSFLQWCQGNEYWSKYCLSNIEQGIEFLRGKCVGH
jgi:hypothetical protein